MLTSRAVLNVSGGLYSVTLPTLPELKKHITNWVEHLLLPSAVIVT